MEFVLLPKLTEKSLAEANKFNRYSFVVASSKGRVTKQAVANYVVSTYKVTVESVNISNRLGKSKRFGRKRSQFKLPDQKVFTIKLKAGDKIPGFNFNEEAAK